MRSRLTKADLDSTKHVVCWRCKQTTASEPAIAHQDMQQCMIAMFSGSLSHCRKLFTSLCSSASTYYDSELLAMWADFMSLQLSHAYLMSSLDVRHIMKCTRLSPLLLAERVWKQGYSTDTLQQPLVLSTCSIRWHSLTIRVIVYRRSKNFHVKNNSRKKFSC